MGKLLCLSLLTLGSVLQAAEGQPIEGCIRNSEGYTCQFEETVCNYHPSVSYLRIDHCGRKQGYIQFRASSDVLLCPAILEFYNGLYLSYEDWVQATPCE